MRRPWRRLAARPSPNGPVAQRSAVIGPALAGWILIRYPGDFWTLA